MPLADAGGFQLHYALEGDPSKPAVLLSNSLGADMSMWNAQMAALQTSFRVLRYDTRGHGRSELPNTSCTLVALGQDVIALLDALGLERVHVCGVSLGGLTAMWIGLHAPERVASLVLSNTAAKIGNDDTWNERIAAVQANGLGSIVDTVVSRWFTPPFQKRTETFAAQKAMLLRCSDAGYTAASAAIRDTDLRTDIHSLAVPTLVLSGKDDIVTPPADGHALHRAIAGSDFLQVPGAHLSNIEEPQAYNRALLPFLQRHDAARESTS